MSEFVNPKVTDAVTQTNVKVVGESPAMSMGSMYQSSAHSAGLMFHNAVNAQNNQFITGLTSTTQGVIQIYSLDTVADAVSIAKTMSGQ